MGLTSYDELIGVTEWLDQQEAIAHWKAKGLDFSKIFDKPDAIGPVATRKVTQQDHGIDHILDRKLIEEAKPALEQGQTVEIVIEHPQRRPHHRRHAVGRGRQALRP